MKKLLTILLTLTCTTSIFAANVRLPQWFTKVPENEYVGISEPGGDENQAITMALLQYMFANHAKGYGYKSINGKIQSTPIDGVNRQEESFDTFITLYFTDTISYDVLETKKLSTGEIICRITTGQSQQTPVFIFYEDISNSFSTTYGDEITMKNECTIQAAIRSNLGDWSFDIFHKSSLSDEDSEISWKSLFVTKDDSAQFYYQPKNYETKYVEGKAELTSKETFGLGMSPYSICDNLLAAYRHLLIEVNCSLADEAIKNYNNGNMLVMPVYSDYGPSIQDMPIVLQTPIKGVSLYKKIFDTTFPVIFYSTNEKYSSSDSLYVKNYIDQRVKDYALPPFSEYAKNYIEPLINEWQKKGEFETTSAWQERVSEPNRQKKIKEYLDEVKAEYLPKYAKRQQLEFTLGTYDADNEVYLVKEKTLGDLLVPVSIEDAPFFKENWDKHSSKPHYDIMGREAGVSSIVFTLPGKKVFTYKADTLLIYSSEEIQYNFNPLNIPLMGSAPIQNLATSHFNQGINSITIATPFDINPASSVLVSYKNIFGKYEMPDKDETFPYVVIRVTLTGDSKLVRLAKQSLALDLGQAYITEQTVPIEDKILFLVPIGVKSVYLTDGNGQRQLIYSGRLQANKIYDGVVEVK